MVGVRPNGGEGGEVEGVEAAGVRIVAALVLPDPEGGGEDEFR